MKAKTMIIMAFIGAITYMSSDSQAVLLAKKDDQPTKPDDDPEVVEQRQKATEQMAKDEAEVEKKEIENAGKT